MTKKYFSRKLEKAQKDAKYYIKYIKESARLALLGKEYEMTIEEAVCYLKKQDLAALEVGTYKVNDDFYFMIQEYETKPAENCRLETHNRYADIQWIIFGEEEIDTVSRNGLEADEEYDEKRDVAFWKEPEELCQSILTTGSYAVLPPSIAHKPQMRAGKEACHVKKCVAKVKWQV